MCCNSLCYSSFLRDESQGVLLGAVKTKAPGWVYEMVDGDRKTDGRTTGDVGFHLQAIFDGVKTYVAYDSVVTMNQKKEITSGAIRIATRTGSDANTWNYQTLDVSTDDASVFGYDVAMSKVNNDVFITWMATSPTTFPKPNSCAGRCSVSHLRFLRSPLKTLEHRVSIYPPMEKRFSLTAKNAYVQLIQPRKIRAKLLSA